MSRYPVVRPKPEQSILRVCGEEGSPTQHYLELRRAFKLIYRQGLTLDVAMERLETMLAETPEILPLIESLKASERGIVR